jgi:hypothetical protein
MGVYLGRVLASGLRKSSYLEYAAFSLAALSTDGARRSSEGAYISVQSHEERSGKLG